MTRTLALLVTCAALAVAGCGDDDSGSSGGGGGGGDRPAQKPAGGGGKADVTVDMKDIKFMPANVNVKRGGTILWVNKDQVPHNVTKEDGPGPDFQSDTVNGGGEYRQTFETAGKIGYVCTIHPSQTGTVTVE